MNRINQLFGNRKNDILSVYFTAGYPNLNDTATIVEELENAGVDLIEIGMPFSDPLADGPTIQRSSEIALKNGMHMKALFEQLSAIRSKVKIPLILMGYINPVYRYGIENFAKKCKETGIDGVIIPDLPMQEYLEQYKSIFDENDIRNIFLISPQTPEKRVRLIDENTNGFIYMVSSAATTGAKKGITEKQIEYFNRIRDYKLINPALIGFGISDHESFKTACTYSNGAIIGSAFVKALDRDMDLKECIGNFVRSIRNGN